MPTPYIIGVGHCRTAKFLRSTVHNKDKFASLFLGDNCTSAHDRGRGCATLYAIWGCVQCDTPPPPVMRTLCGEKGQAGGFCHINLGLC